MATKMTREEAIKIVQSATVWTDEERDALAMLIPELAESEDEKIRKELVEAFEALDIDSSWNGIPVKSILAWLEKQKENPKSADSISSDCTSDVKCEDRWHKVTDSLPDNGRLVLAKDCLGNVLLARYDGENWEVNVYDNEDHYCHNSISKWCEIPSEKQKEQKPVPPLPPFDEMTPEDKMNHPLYLEGFDTGRDVQKVFDEQKPAEWSEEDEDNLCRVIRVLEDNDSDWKELSNWLKSIRPSWKPSEAHLSALLAIFNDPNNIGSQTCQLALTDLYEQLKKL